MLRGWVRLEMTCADCAENLRRISNAGIELYELVYTDELTVRFRVHRKNVPKIIEFCEKRQIRLKITEVKGIHRHLHVLVRRPVLIIGLLGLMILCAWVPEHILFVSVEGNHDVPALRILEVAESAGICPGVSRRGIRNERIKNQLLSRIPELQWAGVNTYGSHAVITVRERDPESDRETETGVSSIVASRDAVVLSCTVLRGTGLVTPGHVVREGDVLISGYSDYGIAIGATRAEGEIYGATVRQLQVKTPDICYFASRTEKISTRFSLRIGKKRINFYKCSGILGGSCVKMKLEYVLTLPGGFTLPITLIQETLTGRTVEEAVIDSESVSKEMSGFARSYLQRIMVAGEIIESQEVFVSDGGYGLNGIYSCREMIGRVRMEEIGVYDEAD